MSKKLKNILMESVSFVNEKNNIDIRNKFGFQKMLINDNAFEDYKNSLIEQHGITDEDMVDEMEMLFDNTRKELLEMSTYTLNPYESLVMPMIPIFYPKLISREAVTTTPIDKPDIIRSFLISRFITHDGSVYDGPVDTYAGPNVSGGPTIGVDTLETLVIPGEHDILAIKTLDPTVAHLEKDFRILKVLNATGAASGDPVVRANNSAIINLQPTVDGTFASQVTIAGVPDFIAGSVNYHDGIVRIASQAGVAVQMEFQVTVSLEENTINTYAELDIVKSRVIVQDNVLSTRWTSQLQKDIRALYDVDFQSQILSIMGNQINIDIDRKIMADLLYAVQNLNDPADFQDSFSTAPASGFVLGEKAWLNTIVPYIERLSGVIYDSTNINEATVLVVHPRDHWIFKSLDEFSYDGAVGTGGNYGPISGRVGNKYKLLVSKNVPKGKMLILMKEPEEVKATYYFAPYVPGLLTPYPLGPTPSMTILSRNGKLLVREKGIALLNITNT